MTPAHNLAADAPTESILDLAGGRSMARVAGLAGLSRSHVSLILRGKRQPSLDTCHRLAQALNVEVGEIISRLPQTGRRDTLRPVSQGPGRERAA